jgi:hypothetical protein
VTLDILPLANKPEPLQPPRLLATLANSPTAMATGDDTTTIARFNRVH